MDESSIDPVIACNMNAFSSEERRRYDVLRAKVHAAVRGVRELDDGFALQLPDESGTLAAAGEWIALERRCCPFLSFVLDVPSGRSAIELRIAGPHPSKEILRDALRFAPDVPAERLRLRR